MSIIEKALKKSERNRSRDTAPRGDLSNTGDFIAVPPGQPEPGPELEAAVLRSAESTISPTVVDQLRRDSVASENASVTSESYLEIDLESLDPRGFVSPLVPRSTVASEYRGIKRPLLHNVDRGVRSLDSPDSPANLIMVTSALQGDGKTFTSINLAMSIASERDRTVLFVDADVVKGSAGKLLGVPAGSPGLIDLLEHPELSPSRAILRTNVPKLRVLPAGNVSEHATELLASGKMREFMLELAHRYPDRIVVFDSPPLLLTTEASVLATSMGQIVFVASADRTPQSAVVDALKRLGEDKSIGVVFNRASRRRARFFGGVGSYGYGYGYGYGDEIEKNAESGVK